MIEFPSKGNHFLGLTPSPSGHFDDGSEHTKMDAGDDKSRVRDASPAYNHSVSLICTHIGRQQFVDFFLNEAQQESNYFTWDWLEGFNTLVKMKFSGKIKHQNLSHIGAGLWELTIPLKIRSVDAPPSLALIAEVETNFGSIADLYFTNNKLKNLSLEPQLTKWGGLL